MTTGRAWIPVSLLVLATGCYLAPWYRHTTAGFTMNAFDLAEWASIHPAVRSSNPVLLTTLLLRLPLVAISVGLVLAAGEFRSPGARWMVCGAAGLLALRLLPPVEFFTSARSDHNYRQMILLAVLTGGGMISALASERWIARWRMWGIAALLMMSWVAGWWGLSRAGTLLDNFEIDVRLGVGPAGYAASAGGMLLVALWAERVKQKRRLAPEVPETA